MATIQKRRNTFRVQIRRKGHPPQTKSFKTKAEAKRRAGIMEGRIDSEVIREPLHEPRQPVPKRTPLRMAPDRYLREITPTKRGAKQERNRIRAWQRSPLAHRDLATITTTDLAQWRNEMEASGVSVHGGGGSSVSEAARRSDRRRVWRRRAAGWRGEVVIGSFGYGGVDPRHPEPTEDPMTEERMALVELLEKIGDGDFLRAVAEAVLQLLMEADVESVIGAGRHERSARRAIGSPRAP